MDFQPADRSGPAQLLCSLQQSRACYHPQEAEQTLVQRADVVGRGQLLSLGPNLRLRWADAPVLLQRLHELSW